MSRLIDEIRALPRITMVAHLLPRVPLLPAPVRVHLSGPMPNGGEGHELWWWWTEDARVLWHNGFPSIDRAERDALGHIHSVLGPIVAWEHEPESSSATTHGHRRPLDGFKRAARYDSARRRSIWYRQNQDGSLELRAGREGGDEHMRLAPGEVVTADTLTSLAELLRCNAWATEMTEDALSLDEVDEHMGPFGLRAQNRALDAEQIDRLCRANMRNGRPWGCAEVDLLALCATEYVDTIDDARSA